MQIARSFPAQHCQNWVVAFCHSSAPYYPQGYPPQLPQIENFAPQSYSQGNNNFATNPQGYQQPQSQIGMSYPNTLPYPQIGGPVGGVTLKASSLTSTPAYSPGHRVYTGGPGAQFPGMLMVIGNFLEFILSNTYSPSSSA
jgi:hypothetical protein